MSFLKSLDNKRKWFLVHRLGIVAGLCFTQILGLPLNLLVKFLCSTFHTASNIPEQNINTTKACTKQKNLRLLLAPIWQILFLSQVALHSPLVTWYEGQKHREKARTVFTKGGRATWTLKSSRCAWCQFTTRVYKKGLCLHYACTSSSESPAAGSPGTGCFVPFWCCVLKDLWNQKVAYEVTEIHAPS